MPGRFVDCEIMAPESVAEIDRAVADAVRDVQRDHNKTVTVFVTVHIRFNSAMGEPVPEFTVKSVFEFIKRRCFGLIRGSHLVLPGSDVLSDMEPGEMDERGGEEGSSSRDREPSMSA